MTDLIQTLAVLIYGILAITGLFVGGVVAGDRVAITSAIFAAGLTYLSQTFLNCAADSIHNAQMIGTALMVAVCLVWSIGLGSLMFFAG